MRKILATVAILISLMTGCSPDSSKPRADSVTAEKSERVNGAEGDSLPGQGKKPESRKPLTIAMVGDIMMGTTYPEGGNNITPDDGASLFDDAADILKGADIAAGNLEGCLFDGAGKLRSGNPNAPNFFAFKMPERYVKHLVDAGFDFVGIANNHINDFGPDALASTQRVLDGSGIAYAGVKDKKPYDIIERDGQKIGFAAFGFNSGMPSINNYKEVDSIVGTLRRQCDIVVVSFHGGGEGPGFQHVPHKREITSSDRGNVEEFAHRAVDAGADVVYGHSPHVARAAELYKDRIIFYSLGNFCTPYRFNVTGVNGLAPLAVVSVNPDGTFAVGQIHSFIQRRGSGPRIDASNGAAKKIRELTIADFPNTPLEISSEGLISRK